MKIRCKNCYRVLNDNEEYCTSCGEHSVEMAQYMKYGKKELSEGTNLKISLILFACIAFLGTGVFSIGFALVEGSVDQNVLFNLNSRFFTSIILTTLLLVLFRNELKKIFFKATKFQVLGTIGIGFMFIGILCLLSLLTNYTKILPNYMTDYMRSSIIQFEGFGQSSIFRIFSTVIMVSFVEEFIFRHRLIDYFDDSTILSDGWIIALSTIISTVLSFSWMMSVEMLIATLVINAFMTCVYMYTNHSLGLTIILRIVLSFSVLLINLFI